MKLATLAACLMASCLQAGTLTGNFNLVEGHAGRGELAFSVRAAGVIQVRVESATPGVDLHVMLVHHTGTLFNQQGSGVIQYETVATNQHVSQAHEWAVKVQAATPGQHARGRIMVTFPNGPARADHELDAWLQRHPAVTMHMRWPGAAGVRAYSAWPRAMKERLWQFFDQTRRGQPPTLPDPPRNVWDYSGGDVATTLHTALSIEDATDLYLAGIAHSLVLEIDRKVPWSLADLNEEELEVLFSGTLTYHWNERQRAYEISSFNYGWAVPPPPHVAWNFLCERNLLRATRLETITAMLGWCMGLSHVSGAISPDNFEHTWGYRGNAPVSRTLSGTLYTGTEYRHLLGFDKVRHYTAGCHGTAGVLISVLHAANIPVKYRGVSADTGTHATVIFLSEDKALTHGDDPYSQTAVRAKPEELLVDLATYNSWLGPLAPDPGPNVGRQTSVLALRHLAPFVLRAYEKDKANATPRAQGEVASIFKSAFTLPELEAARLWERMDAELASGTAPTPSAPNPPTTGAVAMKQDAAGTNLTPPSAPAPGRGIVIEAESLKPSATGGQTQEQEMGAFTAGKWSGGKQLWWTGGKTGDTLTLTFSVQAPGVYRIATSFTRASDYGMISVTLDDAPTKVEKLDLFDSQVTKTGLVPLGEFKLGAGDHRLAITITGSNEAATPAFMVGVDELQLEKID